MPSIRATLFRRLCRSRLKPTQLGDDFVGDLRRSTKAPSPTLLPRGVTTRPVAVDELGSTVGEWVGVPSATRHALLLHGGYYLAGAVKTYRNVAGRIAAGLGADVILVDYRLAPESPYPAAVDDAITAYQALLEQGARPETIAIVGDSAGGGLALALLLRARTTGVPLPGAAVLFSPWTDLTCTNPSIDANDEADDLLTASALRRAADLYVGIADPAEPEISPLRANLAGLPPMFVSVDASETLLDDAVLLMESAREAGVDVELQRTTGLLHVWPILVPFLPEANHTVDQAIAFLDRSLG